MRVTNNLGAAYSLLTASGDYRVAENGKTYTDIELHPAIIEEYRLKGLDIDMSEDPTDPQEPVVDGQVDTDGGDTDPEEDSSETGAETEADEAAEEAEGDDEGDEEEPDSSTSSSNRRNRRRR